MTFVGISLMLVEWHPKLFERLVKTKNSSLKQTCGEVRSFPAHVLCSTQLMPFQESQLQSVSVARLSHSIYDQKISHAGKHTSETMLELLQSVGKFHTQEAQLCISLYVHVLVHISFCSFFGFPLRVHPTKSCAPHSPRKIIGPGFFFSFGAEKAPPLVQRRPFLFLGRAFSLASPQHLLAGPSGDSSSRPLPLSPPPL